MCTFTGHSILCIEQYTPLPHDLLFMAQLFEKIVVVCTGSEKCRSTGGSNGTGLDTRKYLSHLN